MSSPYSRTAVSRLPFIAAGIALLAGCTNNSPAPSSSSASPAAAQSPAATAAPGRPTRTPATGPIQILTQRYDTARTGITDRESTLYPANVNSATFGRLFSRDVDGDIYSQPLYVADMDLGGKKRNVVFVATAHNSVYAFDADDPGASAPLWKTNLGTTVPPGEIGRAMYGPYKDFQTEIGITTTPVIDPSAGVLYVTSFTREKNHKVFGDGFHHRLFALDLRTGKPRIGPVELKATVTGKGVSSINGKLAFNPHSSNQRGALLLNRGVLYIVFSSFGEMTPYHGWLMAYDARTLQQITTWCPTADGEKGGIWMGATGPSSDGKSDDIFLGVADGTFTGDKGGRDYGASYVHMRLERGGAGGKQATLKVVDHFTPFNHEYLSIGDRDLGSTGAVLPSGTDFVLGGSKAGRMYQMRRSDMGKLHPKDDSQIMSWVDVTKGNIYGSPICWDDPVNGRTVFVWGTRESLQAYRLTPEGTLPKEPTAKNALVAPNGKPGGILALSCNADAPNTGVIWASLPLQGNANRMKVPGVLRAYDAQDVTRELWNSEQVSERDSVGLYAKFCTPVVANGKVYLPTFANKLHVYGLLQKQAP